MYAFSLLNRELYIAPGTQRARVRPPQFSVRPPSVALPADLAARTGSMASLAAAFQPRIWQGDYVFVFRIDSAGGQG